MSPRTSASWDYAGKIPQECRGKAVGQITKGLKIVGRKEDNEMEQIQRGLESFLEREITTGDQRGRDGGGRRREPQLYNLEEDWDSQPEEDWDRVPTRGGRRGPSGKRRSTAAGSRQAGKRGSAAAEGRQPRKNSGSGSGRQQQKRGRGGEAEGRHSGKGRSAAPQKNKGTGSRKQSGKGQSKGNRKNAPEERKTEKSRSRKRGRKSRLRRVLVFLVLLTVLLGTGLYALVGKVYDKLNYAAVDSMTDLPMSEDGVVNILLIGNDSRKNEDDGRSDAMILLSVSSKTRKIYMTSLLRDIYVEIPGHDNNRLNAAYSFGGAELLMETVEKNFDIPVHRYVQVNFEAFVGMVDSVGGVDLELTEKEIEYVNGYLVEYNMLTDRPQGTDNMDTSASGMVHLNGPQALAYCRNRYLGTDFGRTERQRKVLTEVIKKIPGALLTNGSGLIDALMPNLTTNLTKNECFRLSLMAGKGLTYDIAADSIPQPGTYRDATIRKMSVLEVDFEANRRYLKEKLYGEGGQE